MKKNDVNVIGSPRPRQAEEGSDAHSNNRNKVLSILSTVLYFLNVLSVVWLDFKRVYYYFKHVDLVMVRSML